MIAQQAGKGPGAVAEGPLPAGGWAMEKRPVYFTNQTGESGGSSAQEGRPSRAAIAWLVVSSAESSSGSTAEVMRPELQMPSPIWTAWSLGISGPVGVAAGAAGEDGAQAGVVILGSPAVGKSYQQEYYEGEAEDRAKVLRLNARVSIEFGEFDGCMKTKEYTPLEPGEVEHKYYCRLSEGGFGLMLVEELKGKTRRVEYVGESLPPGAFPDSFPTTDVCRE